MQNIIKRLIIFFIFFFTQFTQLNLLSQMPDWKFFKDSDGNAYYIDKNGKIYTSGKPEFKYRAVSIEGIDYYLNQGIELIKRHYIEDGVYLLKSILSIPLKNNKIYTSQVEAAKYLNKLKKKYGPRYDKICKLNSVLLYRLNKTFFVINDLMFYSFQIPAKVVVLKNKTRKTDIYRYNGLLLGIKFEKIKNGNNRKFDMLLAVDSEKFEYPFEDITKLQDNWRMNTGFENLKKKKIFFNEQKIIYEFKNKMKPDFFGYEGLYLNYNYAYIMRIVIPGNDYDKYKEIMKKIVFNFRVVKVKHNQY